MRGRFVLVATFAAGTTIACSDAAVGDLTAPKIAATPATPAANQWPYEYELTSKGIPSTVGLNMYSFPYWENDYGIFSVDVRVNFTWSNEVSASASLNLRDSTNRIVNEGKTAISYTRFALPVSYGDTTFTVRLSTNNRKCGLIGRHTLKGRAAQVVMNWSWITISLYGQEYETAGADVMQPACPPSDECAAPASRVIGGVTGIQRSESTDCESPSPPPGGGISEDYLVCYNVWRELYVWDYLAGTWQRRSQWLLSTICYTVQVAAE